MSALCLEGVSVVRGGRVVCAGIDAAIAPGRVTAVIGPNGAGKSSLLAVAAGLLVPSAGRVMLDEVDMRAIPRGSLARQRAYLPQSPRVDWPIAVERVVALGLAPYGLSRSAEAARVEAALLAHDLLGLRDRPATALSGGELARVMLARAAVGDPALLIVDEPTAGLDPRHAVDAGQRLRALAEARDCTVLVALHDLGLVLRIADEVIAMRDGKLVAHSATREVMTPAVLEALFDAPARVSDGAVVFG